MGPLEEIARLKRERRAQLAEIERERRAEEERLRIEAKLRLDSELRRELRERFAAEWLCAYLVGDPVRSERGRALVAEFDIPGHRRLYLNLVRVDSEPDVWAARDELCWAAADVGNNYANNYFEDLRDALIDAEIEGSEPPPAPVRSLFPIDRPAANRETIELAAGHAWGLMTWHAMPVLIGLAYVEERTDGDVWCAARALIYAATISLLNARPVDTGAISPLALDVTFQMLIGGFSKAEIRVGEIPPESSDGHPWGQWRIDARRAIELCREIARAVEPEAEAA